MSNKKIWVGISCNYMHAEIRKLYPRKELQYGENSLIQSVTLAGGVPVLLPFLEPLHNPAQTASLFLERVDALLLSGGADIDPSLYNEPLAAERWRGQPPRDRLEIALFHEARRQKKPVLGVCRGNQLINVALGGSLYQDLPSMRPSDTTHRDQEAYDKLGHQVRVVAGSRLAGIIGDHEQWINSVHHQGIKDLAKELTASAFAPDGVIEAVEGDGCLGIQWHPEWMQDHEAARAIFQDFLSRAQQQR